MRLRRALLLAVVLGLAIVACDRVVDLTPDARVAANPDASPLPDAAVLPDVLFDTAALPDAHVLD